MQPSESELIYDWNHHAPATDDGRERRVELDDETLRDGLQSPSVKNPTIDEKLRILHLMTVLGIDAADVGLPAAGPRVFDDTLRLAREIAEQRLPIAANAAARTVVGDCEPIIEISQRAGIEIEVAGFIGSSPIRQYAEGWDLDRLLDLTEKAVTFCVERGLPFMFVTEDTTRSRPDDLRRLYTVAVEAGARRVCIADTVGHATPTGARALVRFVRQIVDATGEEVAVDWHGHRDRGLAVANALAAAEAGADRLHGTGLGVGERVGNAPMDLLLVNLKLEGQSDRDLSRLPEYCRAVSEATGVPCSENYPVVGRNAFRTATGVHAAAIIKAQKKGDVWLADRVYSSIPASYVGRRQIIEIGPMSGESNVICWLEQHGYEPAPELVRAIFARAKKASEVLPASELHDLCRRHGVQPETAAVAG